MSERWLEPLRNRMYRVGGRGLSRRVVTLVAVMIGVLPMFFLIPFGVWIKTPRLGFTPFTPIILEMGIPLSTFLASIFSRRWAAAADRRYPVIIATSIAAVLQIAIFAAIAIDDLALSEELHWMILHLIYTTTLVVAIVTAMSACGPWLAGPAKSRQSSLNTLDLEHRDLPTDAAEARYKSEAWCRQNFRRPRSGRAA